jgi:hypothetical protein
MSARALLLVAAGAALVASGDAVVVGTCPSVLATTSIQCYSTPQISSPGPFSAMNVATATAMAPIGGMCFSGVVSSPDGPSVYLQGVFADPTACTLGMYYLQTVVPANATATATYCTSGDLCNVMAAPPGYVAPPPPPASGAAGAATTAALVLAAAAAALAI